VAIIVGVAQPGVTVNDIALVVVSDYAIFGNIAKFIGYKVNNKMDSGYDLFIILSELKIHIRCAIHHTGVFRYVEQCTDEQKTQEHDKATPL
jgi:hypothetical protein